MQCRTGSFLILSLSFASSPSSAIIIAIISRWAAVIVPQAAALRQPRMIEATRTGVHWLLAHFVFVYNTRSFACITYLCVYACICDRCCMSTSRLERCKWPPWAQQRAVKTFSKQFELDRNACVLSTILETHCFQLTAQRNQLFGYIVIFLLLRSVFFFFVLFLLFSFFVFFFFFSWVCKVKCARA